MAASAASAAAAAANINKNSNNDSVGKNASSSNSSSTITRPRPAHLLQVRSLMCYKGRLYHVGITGGSDVGIGHNESGGGGYTHVVDARQHNNQRKLAQVDVLLRGRITDPAAVVARYQRYLDINAPARRNATKDGGWIDAAALATVTQPLSAYLLAGGITRDFVVLLQAVQLLLPVSEGTVSLDALVQLVCTTPRLDELFYARSSLNNHTALEAAVSSFIALSSLDKKKQQQSVVVVGSGEPDDRITVEGLKRIILALVDRGAPLTQFDELQQPSGGALGMLFAAGLIDDAVALLLRPAAARRRRLQQERRERALALLREQRQQLQKNRWAGLHTSFFNYSADGGEDDDDEVLPLTDLVFGTLYGTVRTGRFEPGAAIVAAITHGHLAKVEAATTTASAEGGAATAAPLWAFVEEYLSQRRDAAAAFARDSAATTRSRSSGSDGIAVGGEQGGQQLEEHYFDAAAVDDDPQQYMALARAGIVAHRVRVSSIVKSSKSSGTPLLDSIARVVPAGSTSPAAAATAAARIVRIFHSDDHRPDETTGLFLHQLIAEQDRARRLGLAVPGRVSVAGIIAALAKIKTQSSSSNAAVDILFSEFSAGGRNALHVAIATGDAALVKAVLDVATAAAGGNAVSPSVIFQPTRPRAFELSAVRQLVPAGLPADESKARAAADGTLKQFPFGTDVVRNALAAASPTSPESLCKTPLELALIDLRGGKGAAAEIAQLLLATMQKLQRAHFDDAVYGLLSLSRIDRIMTAAVERGFDALAINLLESLFQDRVTKEAASASASSKTSLPLRAIICPSGTLVAAIHRTNVAFLRRYHELFTPLLHRLDKSTNSNTTTAASVLDSVLLFQEEYELQPRLLASPFNHENPGYELKMDDTMPWVFEGRWRGAPGAEHAEAPPYAALNRTTFRKPENKQKALGELIECGRRTAVTPVFVAATAERLESLRFLVSELGCSASLPPHALAMLRQQDERALAVLTEAEARRCAAIDARNKKAGYDQVTVLRVLPDAPISADEVHGAQASIDHDTRGALVSFSYLARYMKQHVLETTTRVSSPRPFAAATAGGAKIHAENARAEAMAAQCLSSASATSPSSSSTLAVFEILLAGAAAALRRSTSAPDAPAAAADSSSGIIERPPLWARMHVLSLFIRSKLVAVDGLLRRVVDALQLLDGSAEAEYDAIVAAQGFKVAEAAAENRKKKAEEEEADAEGPQKEELFPSVLPDLDLDLDGGDMWRAGPMAHSKRAVVLFTRVSTALLPHILELAQIGAFFTTPEQIQLLPICMWQAFVVATTRDGWFRDSCNNSAEDDADAQSRQPLLHARWAQVALALDSVGGAGAVRHISTYDTIAFSAGASSGRQMALVSFLVEQLWTHKHTTGTLREHLLALVGAVCRAGANSNSDGAAATMSRALTLVTDSTDVPPLCARDVSASRLRKLFMAVTTPALATQFVVALAKPIAQHFIEPLLHRNVRDKLNRWFSPSASCGTAQQRAERRRLVVRDTLLLASGGGVEPPLLLFPNEDTAFLLRFCYDAGYCTALEAALLHQRDGDDAVPLTACVADDTPTARAAVLQEEQQIVKEIVRVSAFVAALQHAAEDSRYAAVVDRYIDDVIELAAYVAPSENKHDAVIRDALSSPCRGHRVLLRAAAVSRKLFDRVFWRFYMAPYAAAAENADDDDDEDAAAANTSGTKEGECDEVQTKTRWSRVCAHVNPRNLIDLLFARDSDRNGDEHESAALHRAPRALLEMVGTRAVCAANPTANPSGGARRNSGWFEQMLVDDMRQYIECFFASSDPRHQPKKLLFHFSCFADLAFEEFLVSLQIAATSNNRNYGCSRLCAWLLSAECIRGAICAHYKVSGGGEDGFTAALLASGSDKAVGAECRRFAVNGVCVPSELKHDSDEPVRHGSSNVPVYLAASPLVTLYHALLRVCFATQSGGLLRALADARRKATIPPEEFTADLRGGSDGSSQQQQQNNNHRLQPVTLSDVVVERFRQRRFRRRGLLVDATDPLFNTFDGYQPTRDVFAGDYYDDDDGFSTLSSLDYDRSPAYVKMLEWQEQNQPPELNVFHSHSMRLRLCGDRMRGVVDEVVAVAGTAVEWTTPVRQSLWRPVMLMRRGGRLMTGGHFSRSAQSHLEHYCKCFTDGEHYGNYGRWIVSPYDRGFLAQQAMVYRHLEGSNTDATSSLQQRIDEIYAMWPLMRDEQLLSRLHSLVLAVQQQQQQPSSADASNAATASSSPSSSGGTDDVAMIDRVRTLFEHLLSQILRSDETIEKRQNSVAWNYAPIFDRSKGATPLYVDPNDTKIAWRNVFGSAYTRIQTGHYNSAGDLRKYSEPHTHHRHFAQSLLFMLTPHAAAGAAFASLWATDRARHRHPQLLLDDGAEFLPDKFPLLLCSVNEVKMANFHLRARPCIAPMFAFRVADLAQYLCAVKPTLAALHFAQTVAPLLRASLEQGNAVQRFQFVVPSTTWCYDDEARRQLLLPSVARRHDALRLAGKIWVDAARRIHGVEVDLAAAPERATKLANIPRELEGEMADVERRFYDVFNHFPVDERDRSRRSANAFGVFMPPHDDEFAAMEHLCRAVEYDEAVLTVLAQKQLVCDHGDGDEVNSSDAFTMQAVKRENFFPSAPTPAPGSWRDKIARLLHHRASQEEEQEPARRLLNSIFGAAKRQQGQPLVNDNNDPLLAFASPEHVRGFIIANNLAFARWLPGATVLVSDTLASAGVFRNGAAGVAAALAITVPADLAFVIEELPPSELGANGADICARKVPLLFDVHSSSNSDASLPRIWARVTFRPEQQQIVVAFDLSLLDTSSNFIFCSFDGCVAAADTPPPAAESEAETTSLADAAYAAWHPPACNGCGGDARQAQRAADAVAALAAGTDVPEATISASTSDSWLAKANNNKSARDAVADNVARQLCDAISRSELGRVAYLIRGEHLPEHVHDALFNHRSDNEGVQRRHAWIFNAIAAAAAATTTTTAAATAASTSVSANAVDEVLLQLLLGQVLIRQDPFAQRYQWQHWNDRTYSRVFTRVGGDAADKWWRRLLTRLYDAGALESARALIQWRLAVQALKEHPAIPVPELRFERFGGENGAAGAREELRHLQFCARFLSRTYMGVEDHEREQYEDDEAYESRVHGDARLSRNGDAPLLEDYDAPF